MNDLRDRPLNRIIEAAMATKMQDEIHFHYELRKKREIQKKRLAKRYHPKTTTYKKIIRYLREEAEEVKMIQEEKYRRKIEQIEKNYRDTEEEKLTVPQDTSEYSHLSVFSEERYEEIQTKIIDTENGRDTVE